MSVDFKLGLFWSRYICLYLFMRMMIVGGGRFPLPYVIT
jgi:hypothetical protein